MGDRLNIKIPFDYRVFNEDKKLKNAIASLIVKNQTSFTRLFENLIDTGDARVTIIDGSVEVEEINISGTEGSADIEFSSEFYAGCKDMNSTDQHGCMLEFSLTQSHIIFDMEIPPPWRPD